MEAGQRRRSKLDMKPTHSLFSLSLFMGLGLACDVKQDLGDTASSSGTGSGSGTTSGGGETSESGPVTGSGGTGNPSGTATSTSGESGVSETGSESESSSSSGSGGDLGECNVADVTIQWNSEGMSPEALGYNSAFAAVGTCTHALEPFVDPVATLALSCTLSGRRDGTPFEDEAIDIDIDLEIEGDNEQALPFFADTLTARFYVGSPGFGEATDRYFVLEQPMLMDGSNAPVLFAGQGFTLEPNLLDIEDLFTTSWYNGPTLTVADATCTSGTAPECGFDVAVRADFGGDSHDVHATESEGFGFALDLVPYLLHVESAWEAPNSIECGDDFPGSDFRFVAVPL